MTLQVLVRFHQARLKLFPHTCQFAEALGGSLDLRLCCHEEPAAHPDPPIRKSKAEYYDFACRDDQGNIFKIHFLNSESILFIHD